MIKKRLFKYASIAMCVTLLGASLTACTGTTSSSNSDNATANAEAVAAKNSKTEDTLSKAISAQIPASKEDTTKDETVYIFTDATGKKDHILVNEWIKNSKNLSSITDSSILNNIENVKGDETYTSNSNNQITWNADGSDINYQGTTTQSAPIDIKVTYTLDGKEIKPEDLIGKTGNVTMRFDYTNKSTKTINVNGKSKEVCVPFTMITGMVLPTDTFYNVTATNGKVLSESNSNIVMGVAMPGLKDSLDLSFNDTDLDFDIPDYFEVSAYAVDFELDMTMSVAMSNLLSDVNLDDISLDDMKDKVDELQDGVNQLVDGSGQLADGTTELVDGAAQLSDGSNSLKDGTSQLASNIPTLTNGIATLKDGSSQLADGASQLNDNVPALSDGVNQLSEGADTLSKGTSTYTNGVASAAAGTATLNSGASQLSLGLNALSNQFKEDGKILTGVNRLQGGIARLQKVMSQTSTDVATKKAAVVGQYNNYISATGNTGNIADDTQITTVFKQVLEEYTNQVKAATSNATLAQVYSDQANSLKSQAEAATDPTTASALAANATAAGQKAAEAATAAKTAQANAATIAQGKLAAVVAAAGQKGANTALDQVIAALSATDPETKYTLDQSLTALLDGTTQLKDGIGASDEASIQAAITNNTPTVCSTFYQLTAGLNQLSTGSAQLKGGLDQLVSNNDTLNNGTTKLADGLSALGSNVPALADGISKLSNGASQLDGGIGTLSDGAGALADGVTQIDDGAGLLSSNLATLASSSITLNDGMITLKNGIVTLNDDGISKITDLLGDDADEIINTLKGIVNAGKDYQSFGGKSDDMTGSVKFVYKTAELTK